MADARFEDGTEKPLRLMAQDSDDLTIISALIQDAVLPLKEITWQPQARRFAMLVNRFRWEDKTQAENTKRTYERIQSVIVIEDVNNVASMGVNRTQKEQILSILSVHFEAAEDGAGKVVFTLAGDGALALRVECLNVLLKDVTRPYNAASKTAPNHKTE